MCGSATLAIVLSTPCMIVASMIEAVIRARLAPALPSPPLTGATSTPLSLLGRQRRRLLLVPSAPGRR